MDNLEPLMTMESSNSTTRPTHSNNSSNKPELGLSRWQTMGILLFGVFSFFLFLVMKLPEARIQNLIIAHIRILSQQQGFLFSAEKIRIGVVLGPSLKMYNVELKSIDNDRQTLKIPYVKIRPHLFSLLSSTKKVGIVAEMMGGELSGAAGVSATSMVANLNLDSLDLGTTSLLKKFLPVDAAAKLDGRIKLDLDFDQIQKSDGRIDLTIHKLALPAQTVYGFNLPKLNVAESKIDITISQGQLIVRTFDIGKDIKSDDVVAKISGDGALDRKIDRSRITVKATFEVSRSVIQSFPILDALLAPAKTSDGKYMYRINGPISALEARPGG